MFALLSRRILGTRWVTPVAGMAALSFLLATTEVASAQTYKQIDPPITDKEAKQMFRQAGRALKDATEFQTNKKILNDYFNKYYFPRMTLQTQLGQLEKQRGDLFKYIRTAKVPAAQQHLTNLSLSAMRAIAQGNYHPAVRYNAVLILGMLDEKVAGTGANAAPPVPLPAGAKELLDLLENDDFNKVKVPASLKLGALVGLERHARFGINAQHADRLTQASLAMIAREEPPADLDADVHHWIKCQAARVLAYQFAKGPNDQVQAALTGMIADVHMSLEDRCCVAKLMQRIKYDPAAGADMTATVAALGDLMKAVASDEAEKANAFQKAILNNGRRGRFGGPELTYQRRRLVARLQSIIDGGNSLSEGLPDAKRQQLKNLLATVNVVMSVAHDGDSGDLDITPKVIELESQVRSVIDSWKQADEAPTEPAEADLS